MERWETGDPAPTRVAVSEAAFRLVYQPIVHLDTGRLAGVEALCRFDDGCPPERRFEEAERLGLAAELDLAIIERALASEDRLPGGYLALNLSPSTLQDPSLSELLLSGRIPPEFVTHHYPLAETPRAFETLAGYADGVGKAIIDIPE